MTNDKRHENWVEERANCTLQKMFNHLVGVMESDVQKYNELDDELKGYYGNLKHEQKKCGSIRFVYSTPTVKMGTHRIVKIVNLNKIQVIQSDNILFTVRIEWNEDTLECDLKIDGKPYSIYQISQKVLGKMMFDD